MTIFASLYISYTRLMYFATESLYLLIFITYFSTLPTPIPTGNHLFVLCIYDTVSVFLCFFTCFIDSTYRWNHAALVFPWLISLSIIPSRSTHVVKWQDFILCLWLSNIHIHTHIHTHTASSSFIRLLIALSLLPYLGYYKNCCNEHSDAYIFSN